MENKNENNYQNLFEFNPNAISKKKLDTLLLPQNIKQNLIKYREAGGHFNQKSDFKKIYGVNDSIYSIIEKYISIPKNFHAEVNEIQTTTTPSTEKITFDPNYAGYDTLLKVGFSSFQANNLVKYRNSGGQFYKKEDLLKIYGIDTIFFQTIKQQLVISTLENKQARLEEVKNVNIIELNSANENDLLKLPGIGPVFANRIIQYRNLLGGFYHKGQLSEVYNLSPETFTKIEELIKVDTTHIQKIRLNFADYNQMVKHPYIISSHANAIIKYRSKNGNYTETNQLLNISGIDSAFYEKVRHYFTCR